MRNRLPPTVDTAVVVGAVVVDIAARTCHSGGFGCVGIDVVAITATIIAVPYLVSAIYGYSKDRC
jgi:TRAP-type mannitol/chloroaromatic compound transport system permease large subunit